MSVKLRLHRIGKKKAPFYRIVAVDSRKPRDGKYLEKIGLYNPVAIPQEADIDKEKAIKWLDLGAIPSDTVKNLFRRQGILLEWHLAKQGADQDTIAKELENWTLVQAERVKRREARAAMKDREKVKAAKAEEAEKAKDEAEQPAAQEAQPEADTAAAEATQDVAETEAPAAGEAQPEADTAAAEATQDVAETEAPAAEEAQPEADTAAAEATQDVAETEAPAAGEAQPEADTAAAEATQDVAETEAPAAEEAVDKEAAKNQEEKTESN